MMPNVVRLGFTLAEGHIVEQVPQAAIFHGLFSL